MKKILSLYESAALIAALLCSCSGGELRPSGSQALGMSLDRKALYVASAEHNAVARIDRRSQTAQLIDAGAEPSRLAVGGGRVFVSLRAERKIAVFRENSDDLLLVSKLEVGAEPFGLVLNADATRLYVAVALDGEVREIDTTSLEIRRSFPVPDEPRWLAIHPDGQALYVGSALKGRLSWIDLSTDGTEAVHRIALPSINLSGGPTPVPLSARITGDLAVRAGGDWLATPAFYVDNRSAVTDPNDLPAGTIDAPKDAPNSGQVGYAASGGRFNTVVVLTPIEDHRPKIEDVQPVLLGRDGYPSGVNFSPNGDYVLASIEGGSMVIALPTELQEPKRSLFDVFGGHSIEKVMPLDASPDGFAFRQTIRQFAPAGVRSTIFVDGQHYAAYGFLDRRVVEQPTAPFEQQLNPDGSHFVSAAEPARGVASPGGSINSPVEPRLGFEIAPSTLSPEVERGRKLFYANNDPHISANGLGLSCATCHFDGRNDGLTWTFTRGGRQTPSLAGQISAIAPVRWEGDRATVAVDAFMTSQGLMGGQQLTKGDAEAIAAFIDQIRSVDLPRKGGQLSEYAQRGKALFESAAVGCSGCHSGTRFTNNQIVTMFGLERVKVRSLVGVAATPPYLHDGSAATLRDVLVRARDGSMGNTGGLDDAQLEALVEYLESI